MSTVQPYGDLNKATILIIGHDPRLQKSQAEAEKAFFFEYLEKFPVRPTYGPDSRKYGLAEAVWKYVGELADQLVPIEHFYVTNLCNEFLPSPQIKGTVLIPDDFAEHGVKTISEAILRGKFQVILPMSGQVFYHLCRLQFLDDADKLVQMFTYKARPITRKADQGAYLPEGKSPFLEVCGRLYHHKGIPLIPILHVKQWPIKQRTVRYTLPMNMAKSEVMKVLSKSF